MDAIPPNGLIYELLGEYDCDDDKVTLTPTKERRSIVHYDLSDKPTSSLGARGNAYIAQDTLVGEMQTIGTNKPIKLNLVKRPNLYYLWNEQYCYVRSHLKKDTINLLSYCNQIMLRN